MEILLLNIGVIIGLVIGYCLSRVGNANKTVYGFFYVTEEDEEGLNKLNIHIKKDEIVRVDKSNRIVLTKLRD